MVHPANDIVFNIKELHSYVTDNVFAVFFMSVQTNPPLLTVTAPMSDNTFTMTSTDSELAFVGQLFCTRFNDDNNQVSQYLGSFAMDMSQCKPHKMYTMTVNDASSHPALCVGQVTLEFSHHIFQHAESRYSVHTMQTTAAAKLADASEANLAWIQGFGANGLAPIVEGLKLVHSPYYTNHLGTTMPSGAFCMIPTCLHCHEDTALRSHTEHLQVALARNVMSSATFLKDVTDLMSATSVKSKHVRCLVVIADAVTLHAQMNINYTPDVQLTPTPVGTERWNIPREPTADGTTSFTGDCEDFAREVYQQCKEILEWVQPSTATVLTAMSAVLHLYVPTIEQGAVDSHAHSKYVTYDAAYRNHIWAALHPRNAWRTKLGKSKCSLDALYKKWPLAACEATLPMLHLEGTGQVYPVVTTVKPGYVGKMQQFRQELQDHSELAAAQTPDMSLQCNHSSNFYKYAIACMTDIFSEQGFLDFTYITNNKYGCPIYDWARGQYTFVPSATHSRETMATIRQMIKLERPIFPIVETSSIVQQPTIGDGYYVRFGQETPFHTIPPEAMVGAYTIGSHSWHEVYFHIPRLSTESTVYTE